MQQKTISFKKLLIGLITILALIIGTRLWFKAEIAPQIDYKRIDGSVLPAHALYDKVVIVNFWSTNCGSCIAEIPHLKNLYEKYNKQDLEIISVAMQQDQLQSIIQLIYNKKIPYSVTYDADGRIAQTWGGIQYTPTTFIINKKGEVTRRIIGESSAELESEIQKLL